MGTTEQKQVFIDALEGEDENGHIKIAAMALSEPSTGSDISSLSTTALAPPLIGYASSSTCNTTCSSRIGT